MGKIISVFCHKGGVGKTTFVHNVAFELASKGKSVLLIDADPQMNLTYAIHQMKEVSGIIPKNLFEEEKTREEAFRAELEQHTSFVDVLKTIGIIAPKKSEKDGDELDIIKVKKPFEHISNNLIHLISGSLDIVEGEYELRGIQRSRDPSNLQDALDEYAKKYDFVIIDTPPSAASMLNGILVLASHYLICPVFPTFFSLVAVSKHENIIRRWYNDLESCREYGFKPRVESLGVVMQMAKRFKTKGKTPMDEIYSIHAASWTRKINEEMKSAHATLFNSRQSITKEVFETHFGTKNDPFILEMFCDFTAKLKGFADDEGVPITQLDKVEGNKKLTSALNMSQYKNALASTKESYNSIANSLISISQKI